MSIRGDGILDPDGKYLNPLTGTPYSPSYTHLAKNNGKSSWSKLAAWEHSLEILKLLHSKSILLLVLPTGVGKTVIIPKLLLHYFGYQRSVIVSTPRRDTTSGNAIYAAECLDVPIYQINEKGEKIQNSNPKGKDDIYIQTGNKLVGYKYQGTGDKFANKFTKLLFTIDASIKAMILSGDINLSNYAGILIDEAHERSVNIDMLIALALEIIPRRPDFKVVIMSATIDSKLFTDYFERIGLGNNYNYFTMPNVKTTYNINFKPELKNIDASKITDVIYKKINDILLNPKTETGDILAFVTTEPETNKIKKMIERNMSKYPNNAKPYPIAFTATSPESEKNIAKDKNSIKKINPTPIAPNGYHRKVIIATNAVESSVTFGDPMVYVIESGLAFEITYNPIDYCYESGKNLVSQASILQRCGRTGRTNDGDCIQLYTNEQFNKLPKYAVPKIRSEDFTKELLGIINMKNIGNMQKALEFIYKMLEPPENYINYIKRAYQNLQNMDLLDSAGNITNLGFLCSQMGKYDIKICKMIIGSYYLGCMPYAIMLGAILSVVKDLEEVFMKPPNMDVEPKLAKQYYDNIKRFIDPNGDHITLLKIYYSFVTSSNSTKYALDNGLNNKILIKIQSENNELITSVKKNMTLIQTINLFSVPQDILIGGGGGGNSDSSYGNNNISRMMTSFDLKELNNEFNNYIKKTTGGALNNNTNTTNSNDIDKTEIDSDEDSDSDDSDSSKSDTDESDYDIDSDVDIDSEDYDDSGEDDGEYEEDSDYKAFELEQMNKNKNNSNSNNSNSNDNSRNLYSRPLRNSNINTNIFNKTNKKGGEYSDKKFKGSSRNENKRKTRKTIKKELASNNVVNIMNGGKGAKSKKLKQSNNKLAERRKRILELIELKNLVPRVMYPPDGIINRVLTALFYGYSINRASYTDIGNKYNIQFSNKNASINKSVFEYLGTNPDFIIYEKFIVNKSGAREESKLNIVSKITQAHFGKFIDISKIKKQL
jgi:HrpA-like RNA helicase